MKIALSSCGNGDTEICLDRNPSDLEYADDDVLLSEDSSNLQVFLHRLNNSVGIFGMHVGTSTVKMLLQNWMAETRSLFLQWNNRMR